MNTTRIVLVLLVVQAVCYGAPGPKYPVPNAPHAPDALFRKEKKVEKRACK